MSSRRSAVWSAVLVMVTVLLSLLASAAPSGAAGPATVVYDSIPSPLAGGYPSQPFQAQATAAFGDDVRLADGPRQLDSVTVGMVTWAPISDVSSYTDPGDWTDPTGWDHDFTLTIYRVTGTVERPGRRRAHCDSDDTEARAVAPSRGALVPAYGRLVDDPQVEP